MKKLTILFAVFTLMLGGVASGQAVGAYGDANAKDVDIALPGKVGSKVCLAGLQYDADSAGDDLTFYGSTGDYVRLTGDEAIGQTAFASDRTAAASGVGTTALTVLQRADGLYAEYGLLASFATLVPTWTAATVAPFSEGDYLYEMDVTLDVFNDIGTAAVALDSETGIMCGPPNSPLLIIGSAGTWFEQAYGFYVPNEAGGPVGAFQGVTDDDTGIWLPAKQGFRIVVTGLGLDGDGVDDDLNVYTSRRSLPASRSYYTADEAAGQTALSVTTDPGWTDTSNVWVASERADGSYGEMSYMSAYTTVTATIGASVMAFYERDYFLETFAYMEIDDWVDAAYTLANEHALLVGPPNEGLGFMLDDTSGIMDYAWGYYEPVGATRRTVAAYIPDDTATGAAGNSAALPAEAGKRTCVTGLSYDPTTASTDSLNWYVNYNSVNSATLTADLAIAGTSITQTSDQGADNFSDTAYVVIQRADGGYAEFKQLSAATQTTATIAAVDQAYKEGDKMYEVRTHVAHYSLVKPVADAETIIENDNGIFCGPIGSPVAVLLSGANSQIHYLTGYIE